jgi:hypothetical protein
LVSWLVAGSVANTAFIGESPGTFGLNLDYDGVVKGVDPDSPADAAGIQAGDRVDLRLTSRAVRDRVYPFKANVPIGATATLVVDGRHGPEKVTLVARRPPDADALKALIVLRRIAGLLFIAIGSALVLLRPSECTWGFFLFCIGLNPQVFFMAFSRYPSAASNMTAVVGADILISAGYSGLLLFALTFPVPRPVRWRRILTVAIPALFAICAALVVYPDVANAWFGLRAEAVQTVNLWLRGAMLAAAVAALVDTMVSGAPESRQRIRWVLYGFIIGAAGVFSADLLVFSSVPLFVPVWLQSVLLITSVALPCAVAYAVVRHRVIDVRFVVNRALAYGLLTALLLLTFTIIDQVIAHELAHVQLATAIEAVAAVALSYYLAVLNRRLEGFTERVFFRARHLAEVRLRRVGLGMAHATSAQAIDSLLTDEPVEAYALRSAAVFRRADGSAAFGRAAAVGWPSDGPASISADDSLALQLAGEEGPLHVHDTGWQGSGFTDGTAAPVLAVPIFAQSDMTGIALYGAHVSGEDIDPDETRTLASLAFAAAAAYEHIEALDTRRENEQLGREVAVLRAATGMRPAPGAGGGTA